MDAVANQVEANSPVRTEEPGAPPWLWFVTVFFKANPLAQFILVVLALNATIGPIVKASRADGLWPGPLSWLMILLGALLAALPYLAIGIGSLAIFFPARRARWVEQQYGLSEPPELPVMDEIAGFVRANAPALTLRANLLRGNMLAFVYPSGAKSGRLAIFGGLVKLWASDREAAQAVLLHELAHYRRGDGFHLGAGSAFELSLKVAAAALTLYLLLEIPNLLLGASAPRMYILLRILAFTLAMVGTLLPVLAATWAAEYGADFMAAGDLGGAEPLLRVLDSSDESGSPLSRLFYALTHPPAARRKKMLQLDRPRALLRISTLFPKALAWVCLLDLLAIVILAAFAKRMVEAYSSGQALPLMLPTLHAYSVMLGKWWLLYALLMLTLVLWPSFHRRYASYWRARVKTDRSNAGVYWKAAGVTLLLIVALSAGWILLGFGLNAQQWWHESRDFKLTSFP